MSDPPMFNPATIAFALALAFTLTLVLVTLPPRLLAQVSPGPLARAHEKFDEPTMCLKCHSRGSGMTQRCLDCHTGIAAQRQNGNGFHGREARTKDCTGCHPDHGGRDFAMVRWDEGAAEKFDHARTGWPLTGKHATTKCEGCHQPKFLHPLGPIEAREPAHRWLGMGTDCLSCHEDPHKGRFTADCLKCHSTQDWKKIEPHRFDHDLTRYPLRGKHVGVKCETCHDPASPTGKKPPFETCGSCHKDAHAGQAQLAGQPADCAPCHTVNGFKPSIFTVAMHQLEKYKLEGKHAAVACASCHPKQKPGPASAKLGTAAVLMRPPSDRCTGCHVDAHGGQLASRLDRGACESCHQVADWKPSSFSVADHAKLKFRLDGAHAPVPCASCHTVGRRGLRALTAAASLGTAKFSFKLPEAECAQCHHDPHKGRFASGGARPRVAGCLSCHDQQLWQPAKVTSVSHKDFGYALEQAHGAVLCTACHRELDARPKISSLLLATHPAPLPFDKNRRACVDCHEGVHGKQFATRRDKGACETCHDIQSWQPASRFVHDRDSRFKLEGAHVKVACAACHTLQKDAAGRPRVAYHGVPTRCESCHAPAENRTGGAR